MLGAEAVRCPLGSITYHSHASPNVLDDLSELNYVRVRNRMLFGIAGLEAENNAGFNVGRYEACGRPSADAGAISATVGTE